MFQQSGSLLIDCWKLLEIDFKKASNILCMDLFIYLFIFSSLCRCILVFVEVVFLLLSGRGNVCLHQLMKSLFFCGFVFLGSK